MKKLLLLLLLLSFSYLAVSCDSKEENTSTIQPNNDTSNTSTKALLKDTNKLERNIHYSFFFNNDLDCDALYPYEIERGFLINIYWNYTPFDENEFIHSLDYDVYIKYSYTKNQEIAIYSAREDKKYLD
jgi:uncharacterized protein YcfL